MILRLIDITGGSVSGFLELLNLVLCLLRFFEFLLPGFLQRF